MVTAEALDARRAEIAESPDLTALLVRLAERARAVSRRLASGLSLHIPGAKALLSVDGGICPVDGTALLFDPWSPGSHRCVRCGRAVAGERHDRHWARFQHLWLAERAAHLATVGVLGDDSNATARAQDVLRAYGERYLRYPNRDNVLGPARLFFSTYLESIWVTGYLAAAVLLREGGVLDEATRGAVDQVAEEAANLIGEFDEGFSNRQTWHNAALAAVSVWFEDGDLATRVIEGPTGLLAHLIQGFGRDGMWYEGENYHLFALRGLLTGAGWAAAAGVDLTADPALAERLRAALLAPALSALPDFTFPARKDSRFAVSLAQPMYLELWEVGLGRLQGMDRAPDTDLSAWLAALYASPAPAAQSFDSYLHEAGEAPPERRSRADLSWWALLHMPPALGAAPERWQPGSMLFESQGLAVLRSNGRYASLECGKLGGGHGHLDRLHLTLHAAGVHWLPDFGTGSYVARDLFWYRSTLAHNAPRLDGVSQPPGDAVCLAFDERAAWAWTRGQYGGLTRTLVAGPGYLLDVLDYAGPDERLVELPWHFQGDIEVADALAWTPVEILDEFVRHAQRLERQRDVPIVVSVTEGDHSLTASLLVDGELWRGGAPGIPGTGTAAPFLLARARGRAVRLIALLQVGTHPAANLRSSGDAIDVETSVGVDHHFFRGDGWEVQTPTESVRLGGVRQPAATRRPVLDLDRPMRMTAVAPAVDVPPALDGTVAGFDTSNPLTLDHEDQYRRSEEPYSGPEDFSAEAWVNWDVNELFVAVDVTKPDVVLRAPDAPPLLLDNERDDIHSDGLQLYVRYPDGGDMCGFLVVPEPGDEGKLRVHAVSDTAASPDMLRGAWMQTEAGYRVTLALAVPSWASSEQSVEFDLLINEMLPGRQRRAGQLVWSGGGGWVWLRGDRQDPARFGVLELSGIA